MQILFCYYSAMFLFCKAIVNDKQTKWNAMPQEDVGGFSVSKYILKVLESYQIQYLIHSQLPNHFYLFLVGTKLYSKLLNTLTHTIDYETLYLTYFSLLHSTYFLLWAFRIPSKCTFSSIQFFTEWIEKYSW